MSVTRTVLDKSDAASCSLYPASVLVSLPKRSYDAQTSATVIARKREIRAQLGALPTGFDHASLLQRYPKDLFPLCLQKSGFLQTETLGLVTLDRDYDFDLGHSALILDGHSVHFSNRVSAWGFIESKIRFQAIKADSAEAASTIIDNKLKSKSLEYEILDVRPSKVFGAVSWNENKRWAVLVRMASDEQAFVVYIWRGMLEVCIPVKATLGKADNQVEDTIHCALSSDMFTLMQCPSVNTVVAKLDQVLHGLACARRFVLATVLYGAGHACVPLDFKAIIPAKHQVTLQAAGFSAASWGDLLDGSEWTGCDRPALPPADMPAELSSLYVAFPASLMFTLRTVFTTGFVQEKSVAYLRPIKPSATNELLHCELKSHIECTLGEQWWADNVTTLAEGQYCFEKATSRLSGLTPNRTIAETIRMILRTNTAAQEFADAFKPGNKQPRQYKRGLVINDTRIQIFIPNRKAQQTDHAATTTPIGTSAVAGSAAAAQAPPIATPASTPATTAQQQAPALPAVDMQPAHPAATSVPTANPTDALVTALHAMNNNFITSLGSLNTTMKSITARLDTLIAAQPTQQAFQSTEGAASEPSSPGAPPAKMARRSGNAENHMSE